MVLELVNDEDIRYNKRKDEIKCRLCKGNNTKIASNGEPIWIKDKNNRGIWMGQFLCYECYYRKDKICWQCGTEKITKYVRMFRLYDKGAWTGNFICSDCYRKNNIDFKNKNIILKIGEGKGSLLDTIVSKVLDIPTYSIYIADKRLPFSLIHEDYGIVGIKASRLTYNCWYYDINDYISPDTYFLIGFDEVLENIQSIYVIPSKKNVRRLIIHRNSKKYKDFKIDHEPYNDVFIYSIDHMNK